MARSDLAQSDGSARDFIAAFAFERPALFPGWEATGAVLWTGVMGGVVAYMLLAVGQKHTPPTLVGTIISLEAVFALGTGLIVGYDTLTMRTVLGFALVFAGTTVTRLFTEQIPEVNVAAAPPCP